MTDRYVNLKRWCAILLLTHASVQASAASLPEAPVIELPDMGDPTGTLMTPQQETELGEAFYRSLHHQTEINQDPEIHDYLQALGEKLVGHSDYSHLLFHFFLVNESDINAFAGPGGYIGVHSGLILLSDNENELASVLAHEIAHVTQRHLYQTFQAMGRLSIPMALAMLAAALVGSRGGGQAGAAAMMAVQAASTQYQINFTRDNEAEADRVGMQILSKSEFDPRAMPDFFERMQQSTRFAGTRLPEFLLTHPVTVSRISDTRGRAEQFSYRQYPDSFTYRLIKAKLRVQTASDPRVVLQYFRERSHQGTLMQRDATSYGMALTLSKSGNYTEARPILERLTRAYPEQSHFVNALAALESEAKEYQKAATIQAVALSRFPNNRALTLNYARTLLSIGQYEKARKLLHEDIRYHLPTSDTYELLSEVYNKLGKEAESHRYAAESYYLSGQTRLAILQLQIAKKMSGDDFYLNSIIDEHLQQWSSEERAKQEKN